MGLTPRFFPPGALGTTGLRFRYRMSRGPGRRRRPDGLRRDRRAAAGGGPRKLTSRRPPQRGPSVDVTAEFLSAIANAFEANKRLADRAVAQVPDEKLHAALDPNTNSVAV